jgi:hypothetical protein
MLHPDNLTQLAEDLRRRGIDAGHEIVFAYGCYLEGLDIGEDFFPAWELTLPQNQEAVERFDFDAIKARRSPDWCVAPPGHSY